MPLPALLAALPAISTGVGAASSILSPVMQGLTNARNRKFAIEQRDYQNWYNSPEQQMSRLKSAGLNPNLVYGSGNAVVNSASASSQAQAPRAEGQDIQRALYQWQDYAIKELKTNQLEKLIELAKENTLLAREKTESQAIKNNLANSLFDTSIDMQKERLRSQKLANTGMAYTNQLKLQEWEIKDLMKQPTLDKLLTEIEYTKARKEVIPHQIDLIHEQMNNLKSSADYRNLQRDQLNMIKDDLHQALLINNNFVNGQIDRNRAEKELTEIKAKWNAAGLSQTFISDLIGTVTGGLLRK